MNSGCPGYTAAQLVKLAKSAQLRYLTSFAGFHAMKATQIQVFMIRKNQRKENQRHQLNRLCHCQPLLAEGFRKRDWRNETKQNPVKRNKVKSQTK